MTIETLNKAREIEQSLEYFNKRLKELYDPQKRRERDFKIKGAKVEISASFFDGRNYQHPKLFIELPSDVAKFLWEQRINAIRAEIHKLETKLSRL